MEAFTWQGRCLMKKINISKTAAKDFLTENFRFSIYEIALSGMLVALWVVSALPIFNFNLGFMHIGITYVWPILLGLTAKPAMAILCAVLGDNLALLSSGTGFSQWMPEYAVIPIMIVVITFFFKKIITSNNEKAWFSIIFIANIATLVGTLVTMIVENNFKYQSKNVSDRVFDFTGSVAQIIVWTMYGIVTIVSITLISLHIIARQNKVIKIGSKEIRLNEKTIKQIVSFYSLSMIIIVITIWIWGPFAQLRYLNVYVNVHAYSEYDLFLIPRILKTPVSLLLYTAIVLPIYKTHEMASKRIGQENKW